MNDSIKSKMNDSIKSKMNDSIKSNWAIIGRIPFDDEDTCLCFNNCTRARAEESFQADMIALGGRTKAQIRADGNGDDAVCFVNHVLRSDTPIKIESSL